MTTIKHDGLDALASTPLALHIRALRQWSGEHGLEQAELAELAGVSRHALHRLENCRQLPVVVETLFAVAYALGVELEELLDPRVRQRIASEVASRREQLARAGSYAQT